jgi:hypothetical protein
MANSQSIPHPSPAPDDQRRNQLGRKTARDPAGDGGGRLVLTLAALGLSSSRLPEIGQPSGLEPSNRLPKPEKLKTAFTALAKAGGP